MATPSKPIILKITDAGKRGALNTTGDAVNLSVNLTHVAIGSGRYTPTGKETKIKTLIAKIATASGEVDASNTLQFSATIYADKITPVYELGLLTEDGTLFAIAAAINEPLFTLYPNVTFVVAFGLALNEASADKVTVTINPNASLMPTIMQNHLAAPNPHPQYLGLEHLDVTKDPHPQYLDFKRFQLLLEVLIPMGYLHHTHSTANPKPDFDKLLGIETAWRRLTGKIIVATDPADPFIKDVGLTIGQKGMTSDAGVKRPHTYPLYTTNVFERYNPDDVIETVWQVSANKTAVDEGAAIRFTLTASNVPDGQILKWTVKEGALNSASNDVTAPDATKSGSVILKNGSAIIDYTTTPDDNIAEAQKHVRLTVAAPANLSMNVPIMDVGRNETVVHISSSTNNGIVLDEYFKQHSGAYPVATDKVRFIVDAGVTIVAPNTSTPAIQEGTRWPAGSQMIVENRGRILGRGGDGGASAGANRLPNQQSGLEVENYSLGYSRELDKLGLKPAIKGGDGGTAVKGSNKLSVDNYGLIAGGGGGGGGTSAYLYKNEKEGHYQVFLDGFDNDLLITAGYWGLAEAGTGGGAPYGKSKTNFASPRYVKDIFGERFQSYLPALTDRDMIAYIKVMPKTPADGINYNVSTVWHDKYTNVSFPTPPSEGFKPDKVTAIKWNDVNVSDMQQLDSYLYFRYWLPTSTDDKYTLLPRWGFDWTLRKEPVNINTMTEDGALFEATDAQDATLERGGRGGNNGTSLGIVTSNGEYRQFKPSNVWRYKNVIKKMPSDKSLNTYKSWYGVGENQADATKFGVAGYMEAINLKAAQGGAGGDIGEDGQAGATLPKYLIISSLSTGDLGYRPAYRVMEYDPSLTTVDKGIMLEQPASDGGKAGFVKEGAAVINNFTGGSTKGR